MGAGAVSERRKRAPPVLDLGFAKGAGACAAITYERIVEAVE
jgi:hypothetical protein